MSGKRILCMGLSIAAIMLVSCSMHEIQVYENEVMHASVLEDDQETVLSVRVDLPGKVCGLSEASEAVLTAGGPQKDFEVRLSDGMYYEYQDDTKDQGPQMYPSVYKSMDDVNAAMGQEVMQSTDLVYPEGENNYFVLYDKTEQSIHITGAAVPCAEYVSVEWNVFITTDLQGADRNTFLVNEITDQIQHDTYLTRNDVETELFWDEKAGKGAVFIVTENACYEWELEGEVDRKSVKAFAETIEGQY